MSVPHRVVVLLLVISAPLRALSAQSADSAIPLPDATREAHALLARARTARLRQDSALASYTAATTQRLSLFVGVSAMGRERLAYRHEDAARVRWRLGEAVQIELRGARSFVGAWSGNFGSATDRDLANAVPIPYFPGRETLWSGDGMVTDFVGQAQSVRDSINTRELIHPLAAGAERWYRYAIGDSLMLTLPGNRRILLRELRVTARAPRWNLIVGSFWFDDATADLARAAYRLSAPTNLFAVTRDLPTSRRVPRWLGALISPLRYEISTITVEFGLVGERFWLPRAQYLDGTARAGGTRATMRIEQRFSYADVTGRHDGVRTRGDADDIADTDAANATTDSMQVRLVRSRRYGGAISVNTSVPRDRERLRTAPELPPSIFDEGDEVFDTAAREALTQALGMGRQADWAPQAPVWQFGVPLTRFNRIEGVSTGLAAESELGAGLALGALVRASWADRQLNGELALARRTGKASLATSAFRRLVAVNDWSNPLTPTASVPALLFGRDDGAYYRAAGIEITGAKERGTTHRRVLLQWRLFAEAQHPATVETRWSVFGAANAVPDNPAARVAREAGISAEIRTAHGDDPLGFRITTLARAELAGGTFAYSRALFDATVSRGIAGPVVAALTTAAGLTGGSLPVQRHFLLGGAATVRGQRALSAAGSAFWLTRTELGLHGRVVRPSLFADVGWAGDRRAWHAPGRPLAGAGAGVSVFDGLLRVDVARGLHPRRTTRLELLLDTRF
jgi:hypothetical protein